jgi:hypothetical protein
MKKMLLIAFLALACSGDKSTAPSDPPENNPPATYSITIENHSRSYGDVTVGVTKTNFNGREYSTWPGDYFNMGSFGPGQYLFQVEIWKRHGWVQNGRFYRIGQGTISIDHNSTLHIYNDNISWR